MSLIPDSTLDLILAVDTKTVIEQTLGVEMKREGANWKMCCPFHDEKTPSFVVFSGTNRYKCMGGCPKGGRGGDAVEFIRQKEGLDFRKAAERVAEIGGVTIPKAAPGLPATDPVARARAAAEMAARHWEGRLWGEEERAVAALAYLRGRGLTDETIRKFRVGLVADSYRDLHPRLLRAGYTAAEIIEAGVGATSREGKGLYDRFKGRIAFPVTNMYGSVIGFGARLLGAGEGAKYLNGAETTSYKKSKALFGLGLARAAFQRGERAVVAEGYVDAMALQQAGVGGAVAACGTALTKDHLWALNSMGAKEVTIIFDGDAAGVRAVSTVAPAVLESGLAGFVAQMPDGLDPDELAKRDGTDALRAVVAAAIPLSKFLVERVVRERCGDDIDAAPLEAKVAVLTDLGPYLAAAKGVARDLLEGQIAARLGVSLASLRSGEREAGDDPGRIAVAEALLADLAAMPLPISSEGDLTAAHLRDLVERAQAFLRPPEQQIAKDACPRRVLVVQSAEEGEAYVKAHPGEAGKYEVFVVPPGFPVETASEYAARWSAAGPVVVVSAFPATPGGAAQAGKLEKLLAEVTGVEYQRAAPNRLGQSWVGPGDDGREPSKGVSR